MQRIPRPVRTIDAVTIDDANATIGDLVPYNRDIVPLRPGEVDKTVQIGRGAFVDGVVFGKRVTMLDGFSPDPERMTRVQGAFGVEFVTVGNYCIVARHLQSDGRVSVGNHCLVFGDLLGLESVVVGDDSSIAGNVVSRGNISLGRGVVVGGCVISLEGGVAVNDGCRLYDVVARRDIQMGKDVRVTDPLVLSISGQVSQAGGLVVGDMNVDTHRGGSINTNAARFQSMDYARITRRLASSLGELG